MDATFQNLEKHQRQIETVTNQDRQNETSTQQLLNLSLNYDNAEVRQDRRNQVLERFLREQKRKGNLTLIQEENLWKEFKQQQDAEEKRIREEENQ